MDLLSFGKDRWGTLQDEELVFESSSAILPAAALETDAIVALKMTHTYRSMRVDSIWMNLTREAAFRLGLLLVNTMLTPGAPTVVVNLRNPKSNIKKIELGVIRPFDYGVRLVPTGFVYLPSAVRKHPWYPVSEEVSRFDLPLLSLTNSDENLITEEDWRDRDVLKGFGTLQGCSHIALLLLDLAQEDNTILEVDLEHEPGFTGVAPSSCELRLALPGSLVYDTTA
ncbi:MAG TPA: hypothetical protein VJV79_08565 [Polyangiaceae bacterium]|nr:hypothetical protein [Polyangiaceae bacterium]